MSVPALLLAVNLAVLAVVWRRRVYRCRCHNVKLGTDRERRIHDAPQVLKGADILQMGLLSQVPHKEHYVNLRCSGPSPPALIALDRQTAREGGGSP